ncbi:hypothetical protein ACOME3_008965 [Neoechinorhynchus agilis]
MSEPIRSRFFRGATGSSSSTSESEDEVVEATPRTRLFKPQRKMSDDEKKRVVRSEKDKRHGDMQMAIKMMHNAMKINDFGRLIDGFDTLTKSFAKAAKVIAVHGIPNFFIVALAQLQDYIDECWDREDGAWRRNLDKNASKHLSSLKQRLKKYNRDFESEIAVCRQNPAAFAQTAESEEFEGDGDDRSTLSSNHFSIDEQRERMSEGSTILELSEDDEMFVVGDVAGIEDIDFDATNPDEMWKLFLKDEKPAKLEGAPVATKKRKQRAQKIVIGAEGDEEAISDGEGWEEVKKGEGVTLERVKMFDKNAVITEEDMINKLNEIASMRNKRGMTNQEKRDRLSELRSVFRTNGTFPIGIDVKLIVQLIDLQLDRSRRLQPFEDWLASLGLLEEFLKILTSRDDVKLVHGLYDDEDLTTNGNFKVRSCYVSLLESLSKEHTKILQNTDPSSWEYIRRSAMISRMRALYNESEKYFQAAFEGSDAIDRLCRLYIICLESEYAFHRTVGEPEWTTFSERVRFIVKNSDDKSSRLKAVLFEAYRLAMHDLFEESHDILCSSLVQDSIQTKEADIQILYNRAYLQCGVCAFRQSHIRDSYAILSDIYGTNRVRELVGQGMPTARNIDKIREQEVLERQRILPYHLHMNLEMAECVYLTGAILTEISAMNIDSPRKRQLNKQFFHQIKQYERQPFFGSPDTCKEHVMAAIRCVKNADWNGACDLLINDKMNRKVWGRLATPNFPIEQIQATVTNAAKIECLKIFLMCLATSYTNLRLKTLSDMFDLPEYLEYSKDLPVNTTVECVKRIVSDMISRGEIRAKLSEQDDHLVMLHSRQTPVLKSAINVIDKFLQLMEIGEKIASYTSGNPGTIGNIIGQQISRTHQRTNN